MDIETNKDKNIEAIGENKKFVIIGAPERVIADNKISYKVPVKMIDSEGNVEEETKYLSIAEEDMLNMLAMAKEAFADEEADKAYV